MDRVIVILDGTDEIDRKKFKKLIKKNFPEVEHVFFPYELEEGDVELDIETDLTEEMQNAFIEKVKESVCENYYFVRSKDGVITAKSLFDDQGIVYYDNFELTGSGYMHDKYRVRSDKKKAWRYPSY